MESSRAGVVPVRVRAVAFARRIFHASRSQLSVHFPTTFPNMGGERRSAHRQRVPFSEAIHPSFGSDRFRPRGGDAGAG